jgi:hypothetical protein
MRPPEVVCKQVARCHGSPAGPALCLRRSPPACTRHVPSRVHSHASVRQLLVQHTVPRVAAGSCRCSVPCCPFHTLPGPPLCERPLSLQTCAAGPPCTTRAGAGAHLTDAVCAVEYSCSLSSARRCLSALARSQPRGLRVRPRRPVTPPAKKPRIP